LTTPKLPERIRRLEELCNNVWWSWHQQARELFRLLDYATWRTSGHNPVKELTRIGPDRLEAVAVDPAFLSLYDSVMSEFDADIVAEHKWYANNYPQLLQRPIAYFSAEYAIHNSLPIYAGGLGVLAGDMCKEACDLGLPFVGVGFMYPQGYFHQRISADGTQQEIYRQLDFETAPINPIVFPDGSRHLAAVQLGDRPLHLGVWQVRLGRVILLLLDTNISENDPDDRELSARLYVADREKRIQQEMLLGIGGVRVLRALGIKPSVWQANEGHTAFMMLERARQQIEDRGIGFKQALEEVRATTVFTTHTPVPAGHDVFSTELIDKYFGNYWPSLGIDRDRLLQLGSVNGVHGDGFNMTALALRMAGRCNAVSRLHGAVTRRMWHSIWPELKEDEVPISHITNGIHGPTWVAPEMASLYVKYLSRDIRDLVERQDDTGLWARVHDIPDIEVWSVHQALKRKLVTTILERATNRWADADTVAEQILAMGVLLHPEVLTIAFVRRFAEYKRPTLIFHDLERLKRLIRDPRRPIQIIFAGKSHPADTASKELLRSAYMLAKEQDVLGRIAFLEDYDMHLGHYLSQGVDVWLNTPRRLQEASGTSGMKAAVNGVLHFSVPDGWWYEGFNGTNGWIIGGGPETAGSPNEDRADAEAMYDTLENEIIPLYYDRDRVGVPHAWVRMMKESVGSIAPAFCARRMMKEYVNQMYLPALQASAGTSPATA